MAMSHDRMDSSVPALVKRGFIGLMKIGEIDGLVIAWREVNVAQHLSAVRTFALDANCEGGTLSLPTQDSAKTKRRIDLVSGYRHPCRIRPITRARRVFRVSANNREVVFSEHLCCQRRERYNAQHPDRNRHSVSPAQCTATCGALDQYCCNSRQFVWFPTHCVKTSGPADFRALPAAVRTEATFRP
jgi:hypothetical protein